jgi:oxygen-independent coproporphyrinogen-3 oxidase
MCHFEVSKEAIDSAYLTRFDEYFRRELEQLTPLEQAGLVQSSRERITVTPRGKLLVRAIAMVFDGYLRDEQGHRPYSKIV